MKSRLTGGLSLIQHQLFVLFAEELLFLRGFKANSVFRSKQDGPPVEEVWFAGCMQASRGKSSNSILKAALSMEVCFGESSQESPLP